MDDGMVFEKSLRPEINIAMFDGNFDLAEWCSFESMGEEPPLLIINMSWLWHDNGLFIKLFVKPACELGIGDRCCRQKKGIELLRVARLLIFATFFKGVADDHRASRYQAHDLCACSA